MSHELYGIVFVNSSSYLVFLENSSANAYLKIQPGLCRVHAIGGDGHVPRLNLYVPSSSVFYLAMAEKLSRLNVVGTGGARLMVS